MITTHNEVCSPALKIPPSTQSPIMVSYKNNIETKLTVLQEINDLFIGYIAAQPQATPQSYNAIDMTFNGYNWTYKFTNDSSMDMVPCQGNCMGPCTSQCSLSQDCCCCDPNMMAQNQMAPAPAYPPVSQGISFSRIRLKRPQYVSPTSCCMVLGSFERDQKFNPFKPGPTSSLQKSFTW